MGGVPLNEVGDKRSPNNSPEGSEGIDASLPLKKVQTREGMKSKRRQKRGGG
jgi:hypothetical protein